ncbi:class A beta-lactamase [Delftia tsuruhatensis]|uniref:class A beta-lactamase n=1 Tax=Delftia tsuruhatensis TaxID=180282 RepID=UPI00244A0F7E|nr:class A beta-lactamase [Delftia tsuruhatensis]MDH0849605.1 class A beta-lactamase [Delftia tsuruhatensis]
MQRRDFLMTGGAAAWMAAGLAGCALPSKKQGAADQAFRTELARIEKSVGGRLGVAVLEVESGASVDHRGDERFVMCSTFKLLLAAQVLDRVQQGDERLSRRVHYASSRLVPYSPASGPRAGDGGGMTISELCEAAVVLSDNTAANLLLDASGGPQALTQWLRASGDETTRLDRMEPELNEGLPGDERDTTTPLAMVQSMQRLLLGSVLDGHGRALLQQWLVASRTGDKRLRAGMPAGWRVGGKTGTGDRGTANDAVIAWPTPQSAPLLVTGYLTECPADAPQRDAALAAAGKAAARWQAAVKG